MSLMVYSDSDAHSHFHSDDVKAITCHSGLKLHKMLGSGIESVLNNIKQLYTEISPNSNYSKGEEISCSYAIFLLNTWLKVVVTRYETIEVLLTIVTEIAWKYILSGENRSAVLFLETSMNLFKETTCRYHEFSQDFFYSQNFLLLPGKYLAHLWRLFELFLTIFNSLIINCLIK